MKKKIARILAWLTGLFIVLVMAFAALLYAYRDTIKQTVLAEANTLLEVPVEVSSIDVSLKKFPYASLLFTNVYCRGAQAAKGDTLLFAREMYFEFDLWNVLSSNLKVKHISLHDGTLLINRPVQGLPNYQIWKNDTSSPSGSVFTLEQVYLTNFKARYREEKVNLNTLGKLNELKLSGSFSSEDFEIETEADILLNLLSYEDSVYLRSVSARPYFTLSGRSASDTSIVRLTDGLLKIEEQNISFGVEVSPKKTSLNARIENAELKELLILAREQHWVRKINLEATGISSINFSGSFSENSSTAYSVSFSVKNTTLNGVTRGSLRNVNANGRYTLENNLDKLEVFDLSADGKTGNLKGSLTINNLEKPGVSLTLKSNLDLSEWLIFVPIDTLTQPQGKAIVDLNFRNQFQSLTNIKPEELRRAKASGSITLEDVSFAFKGANKKITDLNADLNFAGNDLRVERFFFQTGKSDIFLEGTFENVLNFFYFQDQRLRIDTRVRSQEMVLEDFLIDGSHSADDERYDISFVKNLDLELDLKVDKFQFANFSAQEIAGQLSVKNGVINTRNISLRANDGRYEGNFNIDTRNSENYSLVANLQGEAIDIHKLFNSFKNFGQDVIAANNIYGTANLSVQYKSRMSPSLEIDLSTIEMNSNLKVSNGNLKNFDPLMALSDFAAIDELQDVRFATLENNVGIKDSRIYIPEMTIHSNVLDMGLEGSHGFDNSIDYAVRLKLSDVLFNSRKNKQEKGEFDDHLSVMERQDDPNIYLKMTGTVDEPIISLDKKSVGKSINQDLKQQGKEIKDIFTKEKDKKEKDKESGIQFDLFGDDDDKR